jgi:hypothetical protein
MEKKQVPLLSQSLFKVMESLDSDKDCVVSRTLSLAHEDIKSEPPGEMGIEISDYARMVSLRYPEDEEEDLSFSFLPKGKKPLVNSEGQWSKENRQVAKPARLARQLLEESPYFNTVTQIKYNNRWCNFEPEFGIISVATKHEHIYEVVPLAVTDTLTQRTIKVPTTRYHDSMYERFNNNLKASQNKDLVFRLVQGQEIADCYAESSYFREKGSDSRKGTLWNSCMRDMSPETFDIYVKNENCQMLVAFRDSAVAGRALVWNTDKGIFMDRVYFYHDYYRNSFTDYAIKNGWMYKEEDDSEHDGNIMILDSTTGEYEPNYYFKMVVKGTKELAELENVPYIDTLKYLDEYGNLTNEYESDWRKELEDPDGQPSQYRNSDGEITTPDSDDTVTCGYSGRSLNESDTTYVRGYGRVDDDLIVWDYADNAAIMDLAIPLYDDQWARPDDAQLIKLATGQWSVKEQCEEIDGKWYHDTQVDWADDKWVVREEYV